MFDTLYNAIDLILPFQWLSHTFMKNAFIAIIIITPLFGLLSTMVVSNKMSFFADSLGHGAFTGIAVGILLGGIDPMWGATLFSICFAIAITIIKNKGFNEIVVEYTSEVHTIWSDNKLRIIDLHMFKDNCDGTICYEGEVFQKNIFDGVGKIGNIMVSCINAKNQVLFHLGYEFGESDIHDVKLLCKEFNIPIPKEYENF
jgi:hypothetical protein